MVSASRDDEVTSDEVYRLSYGTKAAGELYDRARLKIAPFRESKDEHVKKAASAIHVLLSRIMDLDNEMVEQFVAVEEQRMSQPRFKQKLAALSADERSAWESFSQMVALSTNLLIQMPAPGKVSSTLKIRSSERTHMMKRLEEVFGSPIKGGMSSEQPLLMMVGAGVYTFLAKDWLFVNEGAVTP
jgi:hypothetical protein